MKNSSIKDQLEKVSNKEEDSDFIVPKRRTRATVRIGVTKSISRSFERTSKQSTHQKENVEVIADDDDSLNSEALHAKSVLNLEKSGKNVKGSDRGYRCSLLPMIEVITDTKTSITSEHLQEMSRTPFF
ncbi:hypothetical protein FRX31_022395 [Thalictrum thalictroides]|uniref:Uncharacterized protein n=1 Tax=Thalictrum thalictroides TaxID=46969 RepID=A0A7J6VTV6_THATH|nr:hypothetical protein FRX31_022395 [Thalictrum thalictroides]